MKDWVKKAVFYEIYPQSFMDSDGDGIGDFNGITQKLDYIRSLGCNAIWMNPCYDSPFKDAGYDVRDYTRTAQRYGTKEDLQRLFAEAHRRGIHVLLDLVPGHTSEEHPWFQESSKPERNVYSDRYIWTDCWYKRAEGLPYIAGECERDGAYVLNFFKSQPALNYGFLHPQESWQMAIDAPACLETRQALTDVICYWLDAGCDGFRVDMADSLVKMDDKVKSGTCRVWKDILTRVREKYPDAAFVSEWNNPASAITRAGFDMDFFLDWSGNGYNLLMRDYDRQGHDNSFFKKDSTRSICDFLEEYLPKYETVKKDGLYCLITGNHDMIRAAYNLNERELKLAYAFLLTMPGAPFIYYGDEIGMRYQKLPSKEGGYTRTGSRTPMQWSGEKNCGFSDAEASRLYLPVDGAEDVPNVESQEQNPDSLLHTVRGINVMRAGEAALNDPENLQILYAEQGERGFAYRRGDLYFFCNPAGEAEAFFTLPETADTVKLRRLYVIGEAEQKEDGIRLGAQSFAVYKKEAARG